MNKSDLELLKNPKQRRALELLNSGMSYAQIKREMCLTGIGHVERLIGDGLRHLNELEQRRAQARKEKKVNH